MLNKKILITVFAIISLIFMNSCEKDKGMMEKDSNAVSVNNKSVISSFKRKEIDVNYYMDENKINENPFELREKNIKNIKHIIVVFEKIEKGKQKKITINSFSNDKDYIDWGNKRNIPVADMLNKERKLQNFIKNNNIVEQYNKEHKIPKVYTDFENKLFDSNNKLLLPITIYKDLFGGGGAWVVQNTIATLAWTKWNNNISRYMDHSLYGGVSWYDSSWYCNKIATTWNYGWSFIKFEYELQYLDDKTTSLINW